MFKNAVNVKQSIYFLVTQVTIEQLEFRLYTTQQTIRYR